MIKNPRGDSEKQIVAKLPSYIMDAVTAGKTFIILDPNKLRVYHYKKDDWEPWANPLIYPILNDLLLLEKMKLTDLTMLDSGMNTIRLIKLGDIASHTPAQPKHMQQIANILKNNNSAGRTDIIWGPDIDIKEIGNDNYKYLGKEKYQPTLDAIYQGLGFPVDYSGGGSGENGAVAIS